jgi:hypothetical protein
MQVINTSFFTSSNAAAAAAASLVAITLWIISLILSVFAKSRAVFPSLKQTYRLDNIFNMIYKG